MVREYQLKRPVMSSNRIQKLAKGLMDESKEDRVLALEAFRYFRRMVDENPQDSTAKTQMVDCLKLAQSSKTTTVKLVDLLIKLETAKQGAADKLKSESSIFNESNKLT